MAAAEKPASPRQRHGAWRGRACASRCSPAGAPPSTTCRSRRRRPCGDALLEAGHEVLWIEIARDGVWRRDGANALADAGRGRCGRRRRVPGAARAVRRGRHGPGACSRRWASPYVGAGVAASAVCMDKVLFKDLMASLGVPQVALRRHSRGELARGSRRRARAGGRARPAGVREARAPRLLGRHRQGHRAPRSCPARSRSRSNTTSWRSSRRPRAAPRSSAACSRRPGGALFVSEPGEIVLRERLLRLQGEVHARRDGAARARPHLGRGARAGAASWRRGPSGRRGARGWRGRTSSSTASRCWSTS